MFLGDFSILLNCHPDLTREGGPRRRRREHSVVQVGKLLGEILTEHTGRIRARTSLQTKAYIYGSNQKLSAFCTPDYFTSHRIYSGFLYSHNYHSISTDNVNRDLGMTCEFCVPFYIAPCSL